MERFDGGLSDSSVSLLLGVGVLSLGGGGVGILGGGGGVGGFGGGVGGLGWKKIDWCYMGSITSTDSEDEDDDSVVSSSLPINILKRIVP